MPVGSRAIVRASQGLRNPVKARWMKLITSSTVWLLSVYEWVCGFGQGTGNRGWPTGCKGRE